MLFTEKLNRNRDFQRAYRRAGSQAHPLLVTYLMRGRKGKNRIGITTSKKIGGAVERNRARRIITAAYREIEGTLSPGWDIVFVARTRTVGAKTQDILRAMQKQLVEIRK